MGTTNSEAVVSIISIELRVVKSVILQKVQTKSTISKSLIKIEPVFESGNKNLENEHRCRTGKTNVHFKSSGMLGWEVGGKKYTLPIYFSSILGSQHDETYSVYLPRERP